MGTLGKIRNRSGLLLTVIGFAMLAFILGDFMQSKRSGGSSTPHVGEILGESILIQKFEETVELGKANWQSQNQNQNFPFRHIYPLLLLLSWVVTQDRLILLTILSLRLLVFYHLDFLLYQP